MINLLINMQKLIICSQIIDNDCIKLTSSDLSNKPKGTDQAKNNKKQRKRANQGFAYI